jgi:hypothetical protein
VKITVTGTKNPEAGWTGIEVDAAEADALHGST